jgi:hypothetical protein
VPQSEYEMPDDMKQGAETPSYVPQTPAYETEAERNAVHNRVQSIDEDFAKVTADFRGSGIPQTPRYAGGGETPRHEVPQTPL